MLGFDIGETKSLGLGHSIPGLYWVATWGATHFPQWAGFFSLKKKKLKWVFIKKKKKKKYLIEKYLKKLKIT